MGTRRIVRLWIPILCALFLIAPALSLAGAPADPGPSAGLAAPQATLLGQTGGTTNGLAVAGHYAYVSMGLRLAVLDMSNPAYPNPVGLTAFLPRPVGSVALAGAYAVIGVGSQVGVVRISNPVQPVVTGLYPVTGTVEDLAVAGNIVYVLTSERLQIIDLTNPLAPQFRGFIAQGGTHLRVTGGYAYFVSPGFGIISVADPDHPTLTWGPSGSYNGLWVAGQYAYLTFDTTEKWNIYVLQVLDISNPAHPTWVGTYGNEMLFTYSSYEVTVVKGYAYVTSKSYPNSWDRNEDLQVLYAIDLSQLPNEEFRVIPYVEMTHRLTRLVPAGDRLYALTTGGGIEVFDLATPTAPVGAGVYYPGIGPVGDLSVKGRYAAVVSQREQDFGYCWGLLQDGDLSTIDLGNPAEPRPVGTLETTGSTRMLGIAGGQTQLVNRIYNPCIWQDTHAAVDLPGLADPLSTLAIYDRGENEITGLGVYGDRVAVVDNEEYTNPSEYYAHTSAVLSVRDLSDPGSPRWGNLHFYDTTEDSYASAVALDGRYAYVAGYGPAYTGYLWVVDTLDPTHPQVVGSCEIGDNTIMLVLGDGRVYAWGSEGLQVVDTSDPADPRVLTSHPLAGTPLKPLHVAEPYVYFGEYRAERGYDIVVMNLAILAAPVEVARFTPLLYPNAVAVADGLINLATEAGLLTYQLGDPGVTVEMTATRDTLCPGWKLGYTLTARNNSNLNLVGARLIDTLPAAPLEVILAETSPGAIVADRQVIWDLSTLAPGQVVTRHLQIRVWGSATVGTTLRNSVRLAGDPLGAGPVYADTAIISCAEPTATATTTPTLTPTGPTPTPSRTPTGSTPTPSPTGPAPTLTATATPTVTTEGAGRMIYLPLIFKSYTVP